MLGGHAVAQCVRNEGVRHLFCVPGESHIAVIDGLVNTPDIKLITNRQEGCAAFMAEGYAKSTRKVGCSWSDKSGATRAAAKLAKSWTTVNFSAASPNGLWKLTTQLTCPG
ncbi:MAG: ilvB [Deltaproteobacteria bacterium]|nr:ilvB [Deltaproteobacteria bacterium]